MKNTYYQTHERGGHRAKITIEWECPEKIDLPLNWKNAAEKIAGDCIADIGPRMWHIVKAMHGENIPNNVDYIINNVVNQR